MKLFPPRRRVWRTAIYTICVLLVLVAVDLLWARSLRTIHPGYATTRIVAPVLPNGLIDYLTPLEDHFSEGVTAENNAVPLLLQAFGPSAIASNQPAEGVAARLQMPPLPAKGDYFITWNSFIKGKEQDVPDPIPDEGDGNSRWLQPPSPLAMEWLNTNEKPLASVIEATRRPRFFLPYNGGHRPELLLSILLPHVHPTREAGSALLLRGLHRLQSDDVAGARGDLLAAHRLARLLGQAPTLVERSIAYSLEKSACHADRAAAATGKLDAAQLREFAADLAALPELNSSAECIEVSERFLMLDAAQFLAHSNPWEAGRLFNAIRNDNGVPAAWFAFLPIPYERNMIEANQWYDGLALALRQPTFAKRHDAIEQLSRGAADAPRGEILGLLSSDGILPTFMPSMTRIHLSWESTRAEARLTQTALALAVYKKENGAFPHAITELSKPAPLDPFTERPFIYSRDGEGYTLHSVGPNRVDEGGNSKSPADDIAASVDASK